MFNLPAALSAFLLVNAVDTVWWNSFAGSVVEHRDRDAVTCTLTLKDQQNQVTFAWSNRLPLRVVINSDVLRFPPDQLSQVAIRIGDIWLAGGDGEPNIPAMTASSGIMFILNESVRDMLLSARRIDIRAPDRSLAMKLRPAWTKDLIEATERCNAVITRLK
jgi:hypothetical protein